MGRRVEAVGHRRIRQYELVPLGAIRKPDALDARHSAFAQRPRSAGRGAASLNRLVRQDRFYNGKTDMSKIKYTIRILDHDDESIHLPGVGNMQHTICGYVDVRHEVLGATLTITCEACLSMVRLCRRMKLADGSVP